MSHFTRIKTQMVEKEFLKQALTDLGYEWEEGQVKVRGFAGGKTAADIVVRIPRSSHDIGFKKSGEAYTMVADWWGLRSLNKNQFQEQVMRRYAYHAARAKLEAQGFTLVNEENETDGRIHLVLRRMA